tara:strand:- start:171 stop:638 length:468 start_codon:yes stop_codon:yes gene_type:complete
MMKGGNPIMFSRGIQMTNINGDIQKKEYQAIYDGNKNKMVLNDGNQTYYFEAENDDILKLFNQKASKQSIEHKLKLLMNKPKKGKRKRRKRRKRTRKIRFKMPSKKKKIHYTVKKKSPSKSKSRKKTPSKSKKKTPSKKTTIQKILPEKLLKTII